MDRAAAARDIQSNPLFYIIMSELEEAAVNAIVHAKYADHEARQANAAEVRAIRNFRSKVEAIAKEGQSTTVKQAPA